MQGLRTNTMLNLIKRTISSIALVSAGQALASYKISSIVGTQAAFFTTAQCFTPLVGRFGCIRSSILYAIAQIGYKALTHKAFIIIIPNLLVYHVPSFLGSLYMASSAPYQANREQHKLHAFLASSLVVACIIAFGCHKVGSTALPYTALWIAPALIPWLKTRNVFIHALAGTLITHAVGSVIWLYTHPTTPEFWLALIPLACAERLLLATGTVLLSMVTEQAFSAYEYVQTFLKHHRVDSLFWLNRIFKFSL